MHIWLITNWEKNLNWSKENYRTGLRLKFDKDVDPEVKRACKEFASWLRKEYFFPIRISIYIKSTTRIKALDGTKVYGTLSKPNSFIYEPYAKIAAGDYSEKCKRWGKDNALAAIFQTIAHELTHYFQWINGLELTTIGEERQATQYECYIFDEYAETRDHL